MILNKLGQYTGILGKQFVTRCSFLYSLQRIATNSFHTFPQLNAKLFVDKENQYAHNVLRNSNHYNLSREVQMDPNSEAEKETIELILSTANENSTADEIFQAFKNVVSYCKNTNTSIVEEKFDRFVDSFTKKCSKFSDEQLIESLKYLSLLPDTPGVNTRNFVELWESLDAACVDRIDNWPIDKLLLVCDSWYQLKLGRCCNFIWVSLKKISRKIRKLSPQQLVHTMFFLNIIRKSVFEMFDFEINFNSCINDLSLKEIGIMSMGYFKTQTPIRNPDLINEIYKRLIAEVSTVEDISLVNILKILRYSSKISQVPLMVELLDKICPEINRISLLSCLHVALLGCDIQLCHEKSIELIIERFSREVSNARIKDMERICHVMSLFDFKTKYGVVTELCSKITKELKARTDEIIRYPRCLPNCLHYLSLLDCYDEELISATLDQEFIKHTYDRNMLIARELFCLDSFARINLKDKYQGNLLQDRQRRTMGKCLTNYIPERNPKYKLNATDQMLLDVKETSETLYRACHFKHVLPHFQRADIVICFNRLKNCALPLRQNCPDDYSGIILSREILLAEECNSQDISTTVITVAGWNNFIRDTSKYTGLFKMKLKQLELIGYRIAVVPWFEWRELETISDKHKYLRRKLSPLL